MTKKAKKQVTQSQFIAAVLALVFFALAVGTSVYYRYKYVTTKNQLHTYALKTYSPGEIVVDDRFAFSFNSVRTDTSTVPGFWELAEGDRFVLVSMTFTNRSDDVFELSPISLMHLIDGAGMSYDVTSAPAIKDSLGGPVKPGQTVRGEVAFTLPASTTSATFTFDPRLVDAHLIRVKFNL